MTVSKSPREAAARNSSTRKSVAMLGACFVLHCLYVYVHVLVSELVTWMFMHAGKKKRQDGSLCVCGARRGGWNTSLSYAGGAYL